MSGEILIESKGCRTVVAVMETLFEPQPNRGAGCFKNKALRPGPWEGLPGCQQRDGADGVLEDRP